MRANNEVCADQLLCTKHVPTRLLEQASTALAASHTALDGQHISAANSCSFQLMGDGETKEFASMECMRIHVFACKSQLMCMGCYQDTHVSLSTVAEMLHLSRVSGMLSLLTDLHHRVQWSMAKNTTAVMTTLEISTDQQLLHSVPSSFLQTPWPGWV